MRINGYKNISIADYVVVGNYSWLAALPIDKKNEAYLEIGEGTAIGNLNHIYATKKIIIKNNVLIADKVYISDNLHEYENISIPVIKQGVRQIDTVLIGENSWIGENAVILGAKIGKHCIVGANSVVKGDYPDYSVIVGSPAYIVKRFNFATNNWEKTDKKGNFIKTN